MKFEIGDRCSYTDEYDHTIEFTIQHIYINHHPTQTGWEGSDWCKCVEDIEHPYFSLSEIKLAARPPAIPMKKQNYFLVYTEECNLKVKEFLTIEEMHKFMAEFSLTLYDNPDNSIDYAFQGDIVMNSNSVKMDRV